MNISISFMLVLTGMVDFILWSMGKVPYGALCWTTPLIIGIIITIIEQLCD